MARTKIARVVTASSGMIPAASAEDVLELGEAVSDATRVLLLPEEELDLGLHYASCWPALHVACTTNTVTSRLILALLEHPRFNHIIGWPEFSTTPRPWDLALLAAHLRGQLPSARELLPQSAGERIWRPSSSGERDEVVARVIELVEGPLQGGRLAETIGEVTYEMLMNAMYDAPTHQNGAGKYRNNRKQDIQLEHHETPTFRICTDGITIALEISDSFGGLQRHHVLESIHRGMTAGSTQRGNALLDTTHGGAGLGMLRMYQHASTLICACDPGQMTRVIALFDLNLRARERRNYPASLHLFFTP